MGTGVMVLVVLSAGWGGRRVTLAGVLQEDGPQPVAPWLPMSHVLREPGMLPACRMEMIAPEMRPRALPAARGLRQRAKRGPGAKRMGPRATAARSSALGRSLREPGPGWGSPPCPAPACSWG